jgi:aerobic carbon-monoxide dehydrogenase large subunit
MTGDADPRSIPRLGSRRLAEGAGRFLADVDDAGALHASFVRSPVAHATIRGVDLDAARRAPGVVAAYAAVDLEALGARPIEIGWTTRGQRPGAMPLLAADRVRYVGEPVALVIAEDRYRAEDACDLARLELDPLTPVLDVEEALSPEAPLLHPDWGDNVLARQSFESGAAGAAFAAAAIVVGGRFEVGRQTGVPMECRGALARRDHAAEEIVLVSSAQSPHHSAECLAQALGCEQRSVRVLTPDVGGSFGVKDHVCAEEVLIAAAARALDRPVKWVQDRRESLLGGVHSRGQRFDLELAADAGGRIQAVRGRLLFDAGAFSGNHGAGTAVYAALVLPGPYVFEHYSLDLVAVVTNKPPNAAYRGYGAPEAVFAMEGLVDALAHESGLAPAEARRRNLIPPARYPYRSASGCVYEAADPAAALERALQLSGDASVPKPAPGCRRGVGMATFVLLSGFGPSGAAREAGMAFGGYESARVRMDRDGHVTVAIGMPTQGQGIETAMAQTAAAVLGVDARAQVSMDSSDTGRVPYSPVGAIASRGAVVGGAAVQAAAQGVAAQLRRMAGQALNVGADDVTLRDGRGHAPDGRSIAVGELAAAIQRGELVLEPGELALEGSATVDPTSETFAYAAHVAAIDLDPATGRVEVVHYAAVSDCGRLINPAIVRGQVEGAIVQGIGGALMEELDFDEAGQPTAATLFDYVLPTAADVPPMALELVETPSPVTANGARGAGEIGVLGPGAAIANAIRDALGGAVQPSRLPLTPPRVRALAREALPPGENRERVRDRSVL